MPPKKRPKNRVSARGRLRLVQRELPVRGGRADEYERELPGGEAADEGAQQDDANRAR
jgi:hypothetical protein